MSFKIVNLVLASTLFLGSVVLPQAGLAQNYSNNQNYSYNQNRNYVAQGRGGGGTSYGDRDGYSDGDSAPSDPNHKPPPKVLVPGYQTYWSHDAVGYHPCIILALEGDGKTDMNGIPIQLQAQFRVLAEGLLTIGRTSTSFNSNSQQQRQIITQPMQGKRAFELPLNQAEWPVIECKVMAKVGDATSDESQNLLVVPCRIQAVAMSDEDARAQLNFNLGARRPQRNADSKGKDLHFYAPPMPKVEEKPLVAIAGTLGAPIPKVQTKVQEGFEQFLGRAALPGLGDDFYLFEKALGLPMETDNRDRDWVWASYRKHPQVKIYAGSKGHTGKADVIIAAINQDSALTDTQFANVARSISSKFKGEKMAPAEHSVRYTKNGRVELTTIAAQSYRAIYFTTTDGDGAKLAIVAVSRQPGSLSELLKDEGQKTTILHLLLKGLGADSSN